MLNFITAKDAEAELLSLKRPVDKPVTGQMLGDLTMLVLNRFLSQVNWESIVTSYIGGLVDEEDAAIVARAIKALMKGGVELA